MNERPIVKLDRSLTLPLITLYGIGTIVGGGFYALTGKVAGQAGMLAPWAFVLAGVIAFFSAMSFAELSARFPVSAGESFYVKKAFRNNLLAATVGWLVMATGVVSAATLARAFAGFVGTLLPVANWISIVLIVAILCFIACWGISQSVWFATIITFIELGGLLIVLAFTAEGLLELPNRLAEFKPDGSTAGGLGIVLGAYLAFYSFIGFEDMVNVAEEVREPHRTLPIAILLSVGITTALYFVVVFALVLAVPPEELAASDSPFSLVFSNQPFMAASIAVIGMLAGVNGALIQIVMASRVGYGMAKNNLAPSLFSILHPVRRTPIRGTIIVSLVILVLALWLLIETLAQITTSILLVVFALVNLSLIVIRTRYARQIDQKTDDPCPKYPLWIPVVGVVLCGGFFIVRIATLVGL